MQTGVDKTASELAIVRLKREIRGLQQALAAAQARAAQRINERLQARSTEIARAWMALTASLGCLPVGIALVIFAMTFGDADRAIWLGGILAIIWVVLLMATVHKWRSVIRIQSKVDEMEAEEAVDLRRLSNSLERKKADLKRHQAIVSGARFKNRVN